MKHAPALIIMERKFLRSVTHMISKPRSLRKQFSKERYNHIVAVIAALRDLRPRFGGGAAQYYIAETIQCLKAGLLFGALCVCLSFLELFVRDLLLAEYAERLTDQDARSQLDKIEQELEDSRPRLFFKHLLSKLSDLGVVTQLDTQPVAEIYSEIRTPLYHGLTRRLVKTRYSVLGDDRDALYSPQRSNDLASLFLGRDTRFYQIEELVEKEATSHILAIANFVRKALDSSGHRTIL